MRQVLGSAIRPGTTKFATITKRPEVIADIPLRGATKRGNSKESCPWGQI